MPTIGYAMGEPAVCEMATKAPKPEMIERASNLLSAITRCHFILDRISEDCKKAEISDEPKCGPSSVMEYLGICQSNVGCLADRLEKLSSLTGRLI